MVTSVSRTESDKIQTSKDVSKLPKRKVQSQTKHRNTYLSEGCSNSLDDVEMFKRKKKRLDDNTSTWNMKHKPKKTSDLAVHPKKIEEVRSWLFNALNKDIGSNKATNSMLLLTGPPGCGKTATIDVLSCELNFVIQEWCNPIAAVDMKKRDTDDFESSNHSYYSKDDTVPYESNVNAFSNFMLRANRYNVLPGLEEPRFAGHTSEDKENQSHKKGKVVLLEELPSFAFRETNEFQAILKRYSESRKHAFPLVIIQSECKSAGSKDDLIRKIFPSDFLQLSSIHHIQFNAINSTNMIKTLTSIAMIESSYGDKMFKIPDKESLGALSISVNGDIRAAINALQFACLHSNRQNDVKTCFDGQTTLTSSSSSSKTKIIDKKKNKVSKTTNDQLSRIGGKDPTIDLFHAIGKVLYCKREEGEYGCASEIKDFNMLPRKLQRPKAPRKYARSSLKLNPEELLEHIPMSTPASFTAFLHQSYLDFSSDIHDAAEAAESLSYADPFFNEWMTTSKVSLTDYGGVIAIRGLCYPNKNTAKKNFGMKTFSKPDWYNVVSTSKNSSQLLINHFRKRSLSNVELFTEFAPIVLQCYPSDFSSDMIEAVQYYSDVPSNACKRGRSTNSKRMLHCPELNRIEDEDVSEADMLIEEFDE